MLDDVPVLHGVGGLSTHDSSLSETCRPAGQPPSSSVSDRRDASPDPLASEALMLTSRACLRATLVPLKWTKHGVTPLPRRPGQASRLHRHAFYHLRACLSVGCHGGGDLVKSRCSSVEGRRSQRRVTNSRSPWQPRVQLKLQIWFCSSSAESCDSFRGGWKVFMIYQQIDASPPEPQPLWLDLLFPNTHQNPLKLNKTPPEAS